MRLAHYGRVMQLKLLDRFYFILTFCVAGPVLCASSNLQRNQLKIFDLKHPKCESQTLIETAKESFTTIANDLPGRNEYNELVKIFHRGQWEKLDSGIEDFLSLFEDSPLREAVAFLRIESLYDRIESVESPILKEAEKGFREVFLLYPRSKLVPNIQATVGAFWLRNGLYTKSLALFIKAKEENPFHSLNCFFQFGIGENNFLLHENEAAKKSFRALLQKCNTPRLNTGAILRLIDLEWEKKTGEYLKRLEALYLSESNIVRRFYPEALYNLGEEKYQKHDYKSAKFFFGEYLDHKHKDPVCAPYALKRVADLGAKLKAPSEEVTGLYLQVYDQFPKTDIGKFAYVEGMLADYFKKEKGEQERRTIVIDEKLSSIQDSKLRYLAAMNKGIALLDSGAGGAVQYLSEIAKADPEELKTTELSEFISSRLMKIIKKEANEILENDLKKESVKDEDLFKPFEEAFGLWIKSTPEEKEAKTFYVELVTKRFKELESKGKWSYAFGILERWKQSGLWSQSDPPQNFKVALGAQISSNLMSLESGKLDELYKAIQENEETLSGFITEEFFPVFIATFLNIKNKEGIARWTKKVQSVRKLASFRAGISNEMKDFLNIKKGEGFIALKKFKESEEVLRDIRSSKFVESALLMRIQSLRALKQYSQAFKLGDSLVSKLPTKDSKVRVLSSLVPILNEGKVWEMAEPLLVKAKKNKAEGKILAPFLYLTGKVQAEKKLCKKAVPSFLEAIALDAENLVANEARFRMAKCYQKEKKKDLAKKLWQEVVDSKDSFWGPMAKSEINLMEEM